MSLHDCKTCSHKGDCALEKVIVECKDELASNGIPGLANLVFQRQKLIEKDQDKFQWVVAAIEALGLASYENTIKFREALWELTPKEQHPALKHMFVSAVAITADIMFSKTNVVVGRMASAMGVGKEDFMAPSDTTLATMSPASKAMH